LRGTKVRIQVDCHDAAPEAILELVRRFDEHIKNSNEFQQDILNSPFVASLRIVNGADIGRSFR